MRRFAFLLLAACPPPAVPDAGVPLEQYCARANDAACNYLVRCGAYADGRVCLKLYAELGDCARELRASIDAGRLSYDGARVGECLDALSTAACTSLPAQPKCDGAVTGLVGIDGGCTADQECVSSAYCKVARGACGGVCQPRVAAGESNASGAKCVAGTASYQGRCVPEIPAGQSCAPTDGGFVTLPCAAPSACATRFEDDGGETAICALRADPGMPCTDFDAGRAGCSFFSVCNSATQTCQALMQPGVACGPGVGGRCQLDLWCNTGLASPVCQSLSATGSGCLSDESCVDGLCDGGHPSTDGGRPIIGACVPRPGLDDSCSAPVCEVGLYCDTQQHRCQAQLPDGAPCTVATQCLSDQCNAGPKADGGGVCGVCE